MNEPVQAEDYPIIITRDSNTHVLRIRELFLVERDFDLDTGLNRLRQRAGQLIAEQIALGAIDDLPSPGGVSKDSEEKRCLKIFFLKSAIIALVLVLVIAASAASFTYAMREPLRHTALKLGRSAINQIELGLRQAAEKELTPERRERISIRVAEATPFVKLYLAELRPLFAELCPPGQ